MARSTSLAFALGLLIAGTGLASASGRPVPVRPDSAPAIVKVQMQGLLDLFVDDGEPYGYDRHYDFDQYRNATSRKERVRDYYRMQTDMQKNYWKDQKQMQKNAIKRQRGW
ncbi:hypothetical protein [Microvirga antarctica]|uniref:hypothetical protein n=1 Tax=Microvirga antarctica TaxID=2819233 RepID=UPI001B30863C|nr:hypothetical protein [Microvirga antarctica]